MIDKILSGKTIPELFKLNTVKAIDRLCASVIDIPAAYLEGVAKEKRVEIEGRVKLTQESTEQIAQQIQVPEEYIKSAGKKFAHRVVREQMNLDTIAKNAVRELEENNTKTNQNGNNSSNAQQKMINDDWLNNFEKEAKYKSTEEMQHLFGRILAGEIKQPGSYSIKAVKALSELDPTVAKLFKRLCSCASFISPHGFNHVIVDARVISLGGNAGSNALKQFGLGFLELNLLNEYGLIISDFNSWHDYQLCIWSEEKGFLYSSKPGTAQLFKENVIKEKGMILLPFYHQKQSWMLNPRKEYKAKTSLQMSGICFSKIGRELSQIVDVEPIEEYTQALKHYFYRMNFEMVPYLKNIQDS